MRVAFEGNPLYWQSDTLGLTGVGRWTLGAMAATARAAPGWAFLNVLLRVQEDRKLEIGELPPNVSLERIDMWIGLYHRLMMLGLVRPLESKIGPVDAVVGTQFIPMPFRRAAKVPVVYDLSFYRYPSTVATRNLIYLRRLVPGSIKKAPMVVTISHAVAQEISERFKVSMDRIKVVHPGIDHHHRVSAPPSGGVPQLPERFLLCVGTLEPRKNLITAIEAVSILRSGDRSIPPLVVVGGSGWKTASFASHVEQAITQGHVHMLGFVSDAQLSQLYERAEALLFPSRYEGFGMPIVEAMQRGCPVISSDRGSMLEAGGDAALYADPDDPSSFAAAIERLLSDDELRASMVAKGRHHSEGFTWDAAGRSLRDAISLAVDRFRSRS